MLSIVIAIVLTEITLNLFFRANDPYRKKKRCAADMKYIESQFFPNEEYFFYPEPELSGMPQQSLFTTNNIGFRGPHLVYPKPPDEYRIFMVGGSTTECLYLDDTLTITYVLQSYLNSHCPDIAVFKVYNAGKGGDKSYDHVAMISQRIIHLQPDMIIVFPGINDLLAAICGVDYIHLPKTRNIYYSFLDLTKHLLTEFQIPRYIYYILIPKSDEDIMTEIPFYSNYKRQVELRKSYPVSKKRPRTGLSLYRNNILSIIAIAHAHDIELVLMTQITTWNSKVDARVSEWHWLTHRNGVTYSELLMDRAMEAYNDVARQLALEYDVQLFDLAREMPKSLDYIYDDCHFNVRGAHRAGALLGDFIMQNCREFSGNGSIPSH